MTTLSDVTHATVEQVDEVIAARCDKHKEDLAVLHQQYLYDKATLRRECISALKTLRLYRDALAAEQTGGGE